MSLYDMCQVLNIIGALLAKFHVLEIICLVHGFIKEIKFGPELA